MQQYALADPSAISARAFDDEIVAAHFTTGIYYTFRDAAAEIWQGLMAGVPDDRVAQMVAQHSNLTPQQFTLAARQFIAQLENERLIKAATVSIAQTWQPRTPREPFGPPVYERFTDMEELLLLDPIHDVGIPGGPDTVPAKAN